MWRAHSPLLFHYNVLSAVLNPKHVLACPTSAIYPPPLLPGTEASHPAARAHTQTIRSSFAFFSNPPTAFPPLALSLSLFHTQAHDCRLPTPIHLIIKCWRPPGLPPPPPGIWCKQCWHSPHPNCSTCSTWPHMFRFFSYNKLVQKLQHELGLQVGLFCQHPVLAQRHVHTHVLFWVMIRPRLAALRIH